MKKLINSTNSEFYTKLICSLLMAYFFAYWLYQAIELFRYPIPTEYRDWGVIDLSNKIYGNKSPYSFTEGPPFMFVYGALFSILMGAFSVFLGVTGLTTTKIFVIACVLGSASIIAYEIFHMTRSRFYAGLGFCCMLWANFNSGVIFILRPDALGLLLCLLSLVVIRRATTPIHLLACSIFIVLTFYTKQYFIFVAAPIAFYLAISRGYLFALAFILTLLLFFSLSFFLVFNLWPAYFYQSILAQFNSVGGPWSYSAFQGLMFAYTYWPFLAFTAYYVVDLIKKRVPISASENLYLYVFLISMLCLVPMGRNAGAFLSYHYQLALPALTVIALYSLKRFESHVIRMVSIWVVVSLCIFHGEILKFNSIYSAEALRQWEMAESIVEKEHGNILVATPILSQFKGDFTRLDNGHSECYTALVSRPYPILDWIYPKRTAYFAKYKHFYSEIVDKIEAQQYQLIVVTSGYHPMIAQSVLEKNYQMVRQIELQTGVQIWKTEFWTIKNL